jgi:arylsulfatase A-like enzyme
MRVSLSLFFTCLSLLAAAPGDARENAPERPPNIVLIVSDDLGYPYHGFLGNEIVRTPNLDQLAAEGTTFTHAFSPASVCQPALQTLLSGLHPRSWKAQRGRLEEAMGERFLPRTEVEQFVTLPRQLARKGYRTFQGGETLGGRLRIGGIRRGNDRCAP